MKSALAILGFLIAVSAGAQVSNPSIILVSVAPSGSCSAGLPNQQVISTGAIYSCQGSAWAPLPTPLRTTPVRIATFGDSTASIGDVNNLSDPEYNYAFVPNWQSGTVTLNAPTGNKYLAEIDYPEAFVVFNGGVSGQTTTQMLARDTTNATSANRSITALIDSKPDVVLCRCGSINDISGGNPSTLPGLIATDIANHELIWQRLMAAHIPIIDTGIYGYSVAGTYLANVQAAIVQINSALAVYAAQYPGQIYFISPEGVVSTSGAYINNVTVDGTHLSLYGQYLEAQKEDAALTQLFGASDATVYKGKNLFPNPTFANTTTNANGTYGVGLSIGASNATRQNCQIQPINGENFQTCDYAITAATNIGSINVAFDPSPTGGLNIQPGDVYGFECDVYFTGLNGYVPTLNSVEARVDIRDSIGSGRILNDFLGPTSYPPANGYTGLQPGIFIGHISSAPIYMGDSSANLTTVTQFFILFGTSDAAGTYRVGIANPRIVKLTGSQVLGYGSATLAAGTVVAPNTINSIFPGSYYSLSATSAGTLGAQFVSAQTNGYSTSASTSGTTLTVGGTAFGTWAVGQALQGFGVPPGTTITALGTGTGGLGTYTIACATTCPTSIAAEPMSGKSFTLGSTSGTDASTIRWVESGFTPY